MCKLLVDVTLRKSAFELLEDVVAYQHLRGWYISHCPQKAYIKRKYFEDVEIFVELQWILNLADTMNLVNQAGIFEPSDGHFEIL